MDAPRTQCQDCGNIFDYKIPRCPKCGSNKRMGVININTTPILLDKNYRLSGLAIAFVVGTILDLILLFTDSIDSVWFFILMPPVLIVIGYYLGLMLDKSYKNSNQYQEDLKIQKQHEKNTEEFNRRISEISEANKIKYELPKNTRDYKEVSYLRGHPEFSSQMRFFVWIKDNNLHLVDSNLGSKCKGGVKISLDNIKSFTRKGDIRTETRVTGGGGGGSSIKGAVIGEVIAGPAGAIIGSRKKNEAIKTENVVIDERQTIMEIDYNGERKFLFFDSKAYDAFLHMIPDKEISFVISNNEINATSPITTSL
ncbi:MAG: hypothetical protein US15_C0020G0009 [Candidatus Moranbacteria bacterium GW2011_GWF1_36_4]|nr:MAG: hypothetical protein US15_C0020G0009 [Candidatus Moranbacteria bacterium GW2011_GWF1_36_4]